MPAIAESQGSLFDAMPLKTNPATEPREPGAHTVVAAFVDSYRQHHSGGDPVKRDIGRVARDAKAILTAGRATVEELVLAAKLTGSGPYSNIGVSLNINRDNGKRPGTRSKGIAPPTPHDDPVWSEMVARQAEERTARGEDPALAEWLAGASEQDAQAARAGDAA